MNITPIRNVSFGRVYLSDDKSTKDAVKAFVKDKNSLDFFSKTLDNLDLASKNYSMELSAEKEKCAYVFYLNNNDIPGQKCSAAIPNSCMHTTWERREGFSKAMDHLVVGCENLVETAETSVSEEDIDQLFNSRKIYK